MVIPKINSAHGSDTRNILNRAIDLINAQGESIQDLVAEGQLTPEQYAELLKIIHNTVDSGEWESINERLDNLYLEPGNTDVEVQDARNSLVRGGTFETLKGRFEQLEKEVIFNIKNEVKNSDFSEGFENFVGSFSSGELRGEVYISTGDGTNSIPRLIQYISGVNSGDVVYAAFKGKPLNSKIDFLDITIRDSSNNQRVEKVYTKPSVGINKTYSLYQPVTGDGGELSFEIRHGYSSSSVANNKSMEISKPMFLNLTKVFGKGNEPTEKEVELFLSIYSDGYFKTSGNYYNTKVINTLLNSDIETTRLKDASITTSKTDFIEEVNQDISRTSLIRTYFDYTENGIILKDLAGFKTYRFLLERNVFYTIKIDDGSAGRITAVTTNKTLVGADTAEGYLADNIIHDDTTGKERVISFKNENAAALYVTVGNGAFTAIPTLSKVKEYKFNAPLNVSPRFGIKYSAIENNTQNTLTKEKEEYPILFAVKMSNARTEERGYSQHPVPIGWLYYEPKEPYNILYSSGTPDKMEKIFTWDKSVTWNGTSTPADYSPFITKNGDIIFVYRGEFASQSNARQNPIVYKYGNYENPIEVNLTGEKPTSWLQNSGADYLYNAEKFIFAEYTRPVHTSAYIWTVSEPVENPENWKITKTFPIENTANGIEHMHTVNFDPYSGVTYATTGDSDLESKMLASNDNGETWDIIHQGNQHEIRLLNFVFTEDYIYWATDSGVTDHSLFRASRGTDGVLDVGTIEDLYRFDTRAATYAVALIDSPPGLLILNRWDITTAEPLDIYFWSFETNSMHIIDSLNALDDVPTTFGFRNDAVSWYPSPNEKRIVVGFGRYPNDIEILGNIKGANSHRVANLAMEVIYK